MVQRGSCCEAIRIDKSVPAAELPHTPAMAATAVIAPRFDGVPQVAAIGAERSTVDVAQHATGPPRHLRLLRLLL
ncbi:MAG TPA: hypothetical protein VGO62_16855 [Myxococcota bacterium]